MNVTEWTNLLKTRNAKFKAMPASFQTLDAAYGSELSTRLTQQGANPALFDYPQGTVLAGPTTANAASAIFDIGRHVVSNYLAVRFVTTIGATPTATFDIQGSNDQNNWASLNFADSGTPSTFASSTFVITTATTVVKFVQLSQRIRWIRVNVTADTNVTYTIDATLL